MGIGVEPVGAMARAQALAALRDALPATATAENLLGALSKAGVATPMQSPPPAAGQPSPSAQMLGSVQMLVALAAVTPREIRRREESARANRALDGLERLHRELLSGTVRRSTLDALSQWLHDHVRRGTDDPLEDDPKFTALLHDVELRVKVELAKFDIEI